AYCAQVTTESMKSGSIRPTQSQSARSNLRYLLLGAVIASNAAVESSARWVRLIPILRKSGCRIWKVRFVLGTSVGVMTAYDILWPLARRIPSLPFFSPAWSRSLFARLRSNFSGSTLGLCHAPVAGGMIVLAGLA